MREFNRDYNNKSDEDQLSKEKCRLLERICGHSDLGMYKEAIEECKKLIKIDPDDPSAFRELGLCYEESGKIEKAIKCYRCAIKRFPKCSLFYVDLGYIFEKHKKLNKMAIVCYEKASELDSSDEWALNNIGAILQKEGKWKEALSHYQKAYKVSKQNDYILHNLAWAYYHCKDYKKAWIIYNDLVKKNPDNAAMHSDFGCVNYKIGNYDKALNLFDKALMIHSNSRHYRRLYQVTSKKI